MIAPGWVSYACRIFFPRNKQTNKNPVPSAFPTPNGHLPATSAGIKSAAAAAADFQHPPKGAQGGEQTPGICTLGKAGGTALHTVGYFQEPMLQSQRLHLAISGKAPNRFMGRRHQPPVTNQRLSAKRNVCENSPFTRITCTLTVTSLEQLLRVL